MTLAPAPESVAANHRQTWVDVLIVAVATVACLAPFANKAFHMDDPLFLYAARQICAHPADPFGFKVSWYDAEMPMAEVTQNGPLNSYYIALVACCFGWSEVAIHLAFLVPAVAAVLGTYFLAATLCTRPLLAALATLLCPVFLVSSTTIMSDTLMLAFWVWTVVFWLRSAESGSHLAAILSACLIAAAGVTKYYAVALIPLLLAYGLLRWPRMRWRILYLVIPVVLLLGYDWIMRSLYGHSMLFGAGTYALLYSNRGGNWLFRGIVGLAFSGGCIASVIFYGPMLWSRRGLTAGLVGVALIVGLLFYVPDLGTFHLPEATGWRLLTASQFAVFLVAGVGLLALATVDLWQSRDAASSLLFLWLVGTFVFCWIFNWTINGRSVLPMAPAATILIIRRLDRRGWSSLGRSFPWEYVPLALTGLLAMAVAWADTCCANTARVAAAMMHERYGGGNRAVWFAGHWGFQYYMESYGFRPIIAGVPIVEGNVLILPENNTNVPDLRAGAFSERLLFRFPSFPLLSVFHPLVGAGFYTSLGGPLPFVIGPAPPERYQSMVVDHPEGPESKIRQLQQDLAQHPDSAELHGQLADVLISAGRTAEAKGHFRRAVQLNPQSAEACNNLAWLLATREPADGGNPVEAVSLAEEACKLTHHESFGCLDTLAAAYAAAGRFPEAVATAQKAMELASAAGQTESAKRIEARLELYRQHRAFHEPAQPPAAAGP